MQLVDDRVRELRSADRWIEIEKDRLAMRRREDERILLRLDERIHCRLDRRPGGKITTRAFGSGVDVEALPLRERPSQLVAPRHDIVRDERAKLFVREGSLHRSFALLQVAIAGSREQLVPG